MNTFAGKSVLITGGLGFIGSTLARRLANLGAHVTVVDNLIPKHGGNLFNIHGIEDKIRVNFSDIRDPYTMRYLVLGQDYLFNLAGQTSHMGSMQDPLTDLDINCRAQIFLLEACRTYNPDIKVVFASTRQIYGKPDYLPVDEEHPLRPIDVNGINKVTGEWYHRLYNNVYGIRTSILRLTNTYGPRMRVKDARQIFLGIWIRLILERKPFEVWGGNQLRDFTYVDDAVEAFLLAAASDAADGETFNLGGECRISLSDLADLLVDVKGEGDYTLMAYPAERKRIDIGDYYANFNKIKKDLGWEPAVPLRKGLAATLDYYRQHHSNYW